MTAIANLLTNRLKNPLGLHLGDMPRLSWTVEADGTEGVRQAKARVEVSLTENFSEVVFDSGLTEEIDSICYPLPRDLVKPRTRYYWRVTVETDTGAVLQGGPAWFETAKGAEPWTARWIAPDFGEDWHPVLFADIPVPKPVKRARAYVCGLGVYEMEVNGQKAGDDYLAPGLVAYDKWLPYETLDLTGLLRQGDNRVEILLGNGWYKGRYGLDHKRRFQYGQEFACICEIVVDWEDGSTQTFTTNTSDWQARRSAIVDSSIFDGETRDDTMDTSAVYPVKAAAMDTALLEPRHGAPVKIMQELKPVEVIHTPAGETVLDMGQNMVGWLRFVCRAPRGKAVHLQFGEVLQEGNFYRDNLRTALCEYRYVSDGEEKAIRPRFTFYGFRYVKLTGWHQEVNAEDFTGLVLYSDLRPTGSVETDNEKVNRLFQNTLWGQRGNFLDVPTDCPQRDERMGWTGDAQVFFGTAAFNMDVSAFYAKFCYDLGREQAALDGCVPVVIPKHDVKQAGACAWGDAATIIPWNLYIRYGDKELLRQQYASMKAWVDYIRRKDEATGGQRLWKGDFHYGDWLALDGEDSIKSRFGGTERTYLASCYYRHSARLVARAARVLGHEEDAAAYEALSNEVRDAIVREYVTLTGRLALNTQVAYILALFMDIIPDQYREQTAYALRLKLKESWYHLRTGFIGTPYLCRVLSESGSNDIAYRLLLQEDYPSWLYSVNMGATTIWERWNSILPDGSISDTGMNSLNHYSYGSIVEWMYRNAAGIQPIEEAPGFRRFRLAPQPHYLLGRAQARFESPAGLIESGWELLDSGELKVTCTVPFGATALLTLPHGEHSGYPVEQELTCGTYTFQYRPSVPMAPVLDLDTPISEIYRHPGAAAVLEERLPEFTGMMLFTMLAGERSLNDFVREGYLAFTPEEAGELCEKMEKARAGCPVRH